MPELLLPLLGTAVLTLGWLWFFVRRDRNPEPAWLLARTFAWGMFAWGVAAAFGSSFGHLLGGWPLAPLLLIFLTALTEESSKFLAAYTAVTEPDFDEPMDGLVYAVTAALGFALMENVTYILGFGGDIGAFAGRALITTLAHALFSAPQGYALGQLHELCGRVPRAALRGRLLRGFLVSVALHFTFNTLLDNEPGGPVLVGLTVTLFLMGLLALRFYRRYEAQAKEASGGQD